MKTTVAKKADIKEVLKLHQSLALEGDPELKLTEAESIYERIQSYPDYSIYISKYDGKLVGTFALLIMDNLAHGGAKSGVLEDMVVSKNMRGNGFGRILVEEAIRICQEKQCYKLTLSSNLERLRAHKFYESIGFEKHGYSYSMRLR